MSERIAVNIPDQAEKSSVKVGTGGLTVPVIADQYAWLLGATGMSQAIAIIAGAMGVRFILQTIPFVHYDPQRTTGIVWRIKRTPIAPAIMAIACDMPVAPSSQAYSLAIVGTVRPPVPTEAMSASTGDNTESHPTTQISRTLWIMSIRKQ